jgi:predicted DNA-binding transcriptional regulator YafY
MAFESFHSETEFGTVIWRFNSEAAPVAREYVFHPNQIIQDDSDGGLIVRFEAAGWLEMAWHLYKWGNTVEVIAPDQLRRMVTGHQRTDFPSLP